MLCVTDYRRSKIVNAVAAVVSTLLLLTSVILTYRVSTKGKPIIESTDLFVAVLCLSVAAAVFTVLFIVFNNCKAHPIDNYLGDSRESLLRAIAERESAQSRTETEQQTDPQNLSSSAAASTPTHVELDTKGSSVAALFKKASASTHPPPPSSSSATDIPSSATSSTLPADSKSDKISPLSSSHPISSAASGSPVDPFLQSTAVTVTGN